MPQYYFDVRDSRGLVRDEEGMELPDRAQAEREAFLALVEMSKLLEDEDFPQRVTIDIRTAKGRVAVAKLALDLERLPEF